MSDTNALEEVAESEEQESETEDFEEDAGPEVDPEIEKQARAWGWKPKDEYAGPDERWKPADQFVEDGERVLPVVRAEKRKLEGMLAEERKQRAKEREDFQKRVDAIERTSKIALERQRQQIVTDYDQRKRDAVRMNDEDAYEKAATEEREALASLDDEVSKQAEDTTGDDGGDNASAGNLSADDARTVRHWMASNPWFNENAGMKAQANLHLDIVEEESPNLSMEEKLGEVRKRIMNDYPEKFEMKERSTTTSTPSLQGGSRGGSSRANGRMANKLPAEAKQAGKRYVDEGLFKDMEEYAQAYFEDEG